MGFTIKYLKLKKFETIERKNFAKPAALNSFVFLGPENSLNYFLRKNYLHSSFTILSTIDP